MSGGRAVPWRAWLLAGTVSALLAGAAIYLAVSHARGGGTGGGDVTMSHVAYRSVVVGPVAWLDLHRAYAGKLVVLNYMAPGCARCSAEVPELVATYDRLRHRGVQLIGVSLRTSRARTRAMIARLGIDYPVYLDGDGAAARKRFAVHQLPATLVYEDGRLLKRFDGGAPVSRLVAYLGAHLAPPTGHAHG